MNPFVEQLADLARTQRTRTKWVFLPYTALKWTLSERLLHGGQPWANFRFVTPFELALESAAPDLLARGLNPKPEGLGPTLIHKLMLELPKKTRPHFKKLLDQPGLAEALWATLKEIRMAGLTHKRVGKVLSPEKKPELTALCKAYEGYLESHRLADRAVVYQCAQRTPVAAEDLLLEFPSTHWAPLEREFLARLPGEKLLARVPDLELPRRLQGTARQRVQTPDLKARFFHAGRRDSEVLEVLRREDSWHCNTGSFRPARDLRPDTKGDHFLAPRSELDSSQEGGRPLPGVIANSLSILHQRLDLEDLLRKRSSTDVERYVEAFRRAAVDP